MQHSRTAPRRSTAFLAMEEETKRDPTLIAAQRRRTRNAVNAGEFPYGIEITRSRIDFEVRKQRWEIDGSIE